MAIDPRELDSMPRTGSPLPEGRTCTSCGYDLTGLMSGGKCPECGTTITPPRSNKRLADNLTDAPLGYLKRLAAAQIGAMLASFAGLGTALLANSVPTPRNTALPLVCALVWCGAMAVITLPRPKTEGMARDAVLDQPKIRLSVAFVQVFWLLSTLCGFIGAALAANSAPLANGFGVASTVLAYPAMLGVALTSIYFGSLADWAADTGLADRFRLSAWTLVLGGVFGTSFFLLGGVVPKIGGILAIVGIFIMLIGVAGFLLFFASVAQLTQLAVWAIKNHVAIEARDQRIAEKRARQDAKIHEDLLNAPIPSAPDGAVGGEGLAIEFAEPVEPQPGSTDLSPPPGVKLGHRLERRGDASEPTYDLAPEDP